MRADIKLYIRAQKKSAGIAIGPGKIALLEAIAETGSITSAAKRLGMSYRRAWLLVQETNDCMVDPAVATAAGGQDGGGTALTVAGKELVRCYRELERQTEVAVTRKLKNLLRDLPDS